MFRRRLGIRVDHVHLLNQLPVHFEMVAFLRAVGQVLRIRERSVDHRSRSLHHDHLHPVTDFAQVSNTRKGPFRYVECRRVHPEFIVFVQLEIDRRLGEILVVP